MVGRPLSVNPGSGHCLQGIEDLLFPGFTSSGSFDSGQVVAQVGPYLVGDPEEFGFFFGKHPDDIAALSRVLPQIVHLRAFDDPVADFSWCAVLPWFVHLVRLIIMREDQFEPSVRNGLEGVALEIETQILPGGALCPYPSDKG